MHNGCWCWHLALVLYWSLTFLQGYMSEVYMFCAISRLCCALSESWDCVPISRLCTIVARSRDCATIMRNLQIVQITHAHYSGYRRRLVNCSTKGWKTTVTETICVSASEQFSYLACHPTVNQIGREQHASTTLHHFIRSNFPRAWREAHDMQKSIYLVAYIQLYSYKICTTTPYCSARNISKTFRCSALLFQIAICCLWREMQGCLPSCKLHIHSRSLIVRRTG